MIASDTKDIEVSPGQRRILAGALSGGPAAASVGSPGTPRMLRVERREADFDKASGWWIFSNDYLGSHPKSSYVEKAGGRRFVWRGRSGGSRARKRKKKLAALQGGSELCLLLSQSALCLSANDGLQ